MINYIIGDNMNQMNTFNMEPSKEEETKDNYNEETPTSGYGSFYGYSEDYDSSSSKRLVFNKKTLMIGGAVLLGLLFLIVLIMSLPGGKKTTLGPSLQLSRVEVKKGETVSIKSNLNEETYRQIIWSSDNDKIATVNAGQVSAIAVGTTFVRAKLPSGAEESVEVIVESDLPDFGIADGNIAINAGQSKLLSFQGAQAAEIKWASSFPGVASVTNGTVTGLNSGKTTIIATTNDGRVSKILLTVNGSVPEPSRISVVQVKTMIVGDTLKLVIKTSPDNAVKLFSYTSLNTSVATVDTNGNVKAVGRGVTSIKVTSYNGIVSAARIEVY